MFCFEALLQKSSDCTIIMTNTFFLAVFLCSDCCKRFLKRHILIWKERKPQSSDHDFLCEYELSMIASVPQFKYQIERLGFRKLRVPTCLDRYHGSGWTFSFLVYAETYLACSSVTVLASLVLVEFRKRKNVAALDAFLCFHVFFV